MICKWVFEWFFFPGFGIGGPHIERSDLPFFLPFPFFFIRFLFGHQEITGGMQKEQYMHPYAANNACVCHLK